MHKNNPFLYYLAIFILILALMKHYKDNKVEKVKNPPTKDKMEVKKIDLNFGNITKLITDTKDAIEQVNQKKAPKAISLNQSFATYYKDDKFANKFSLCLNSYEMHLKLFSESGETLYEKKKFTLKDVKNEAEFYNFLQNILALTSQGEIVEVFIPKLDLLPSFLTEKKEDKTEAGLIKLLSLKSTSGSSIFINGIILNNSIFEENGRKRGLSKFLCGDKVKLNYTIYDESKNVVSSDEKSLTLNGASGEFDKILEYLVLTSKGEVLDASFPSYKFSQTLKDQTLTINAKIELEDDKR